MSGDPPVSPWVEVRAAVRSGLSLLGLGVLLVGVGLALREPEPTTAAAGGDSRPADLVAGPSAPGLPALGAAPAAPIQDPDADADAADADATQDPAPRVPGPAVPADDRPDPPPARLAREDVGENVERAIAYLLAGQRENGGWGEGAPDCLLELGFALETYYSWQQASHGLVCMALASVPSTPEVDAALGRAVDWLCERRVSSRNSDWDIDYVWSALYGFTACVELLDDPRLAEEPYRSKLEARGKAFLEVLVKNQALSGGWAYYDDPPFDVVPTWATSFSTALVLPALQRAKDLGWPLEQKVIDRAVRYVRGCRLPNGAYSYDQTPTPRLTGVEHINLVQGSLGRIQVCNWGLAGTGAREITPDVVREGLEFFFKHRAFLDHVRTRPIPHEGFHANAGYFYFFGHYYAAKAIGLLPEDEREAWHARLRPHLVKAQWSNGGMSDFLDSGYMVQASTAFAVLALQEGRATR